MLTLLVLLLGLTRVAAAASEKRRVFGGPGSTSIAGKTATRVYKERWRTKFTGGRWNDLAWNRLRSGKTDRRNPTQDQMHALFDDMKRSHIGYGFPDGLCMQRADVAISAIERAGFYVERAYAQRSFGRQLHTTTDNTVSGTESWTYHTAPLVYVDGKRWVLDPALFDRPVSLLEWATRIHATAPDVTLLPSDVPFPGAKPAADDNMRVWRLGDALFRVAAGRKAERLRAAELSMSPAERRALWDDRESVGNAGTP